MAEVGLAGSGVGIVSLGITVVQGLLQYYNSWKDCEIDLSSTLDSLTSLGKSLGLIKGFVADDRQDVELHKQVLDCISACEGGIKKLEGKLKKIRHSSDSSAGLRGKFRVQYQKALYPFKESTLSKLREMVADLRENLSLAIHVAELKSIDTTRKGVAKLNLQKDDSERQSILDWLSNADYAKQFGDFVSELQPGTGQWFFDSEEFQQWALGNVPTLFCPGNPGVGKTFMTCASAEHLQSKFQESSGRRLPFVLASILQQLIWELPLSGVPEPLKNLWARHKERRSTPSVDEYFDTLKAVAPSFSKIFLLIDALDEFSTKRSNQDQLLKKISELQSAGEFNLKLFVTSRFIPNISQMFDGKVQREIRADEGDMRKYIESRIPSLPRCVAKDIDLQEKIKSEVVKAVNGMFLLAKLHVDSLGDKTNPRRVEDALEDLSKGEDALRKSYQSAKDRIESQPRGFCDLAKRTISWISYTKGLSIDELQHALAVIDGEPALDTRNIDELEDILSACAGLVVVESQTQDVRFVHYTTYEYFETIRASWLADGQAMVTRACLTYLSYDVFATGACRSEEKFQQRIRNNPFASYAAWFWGDHAREVPTEKWEPLAIDFLTDDRKVESAVEIWRSQRKNELDAAFSWEDVGTNSAHMVARFGLESLMTTLIELKVPLNKTGFLGHTPMSMAAQEGHKPIVKLFLESKIDDDPRNCDIYDSLTRSLYWAANYGHEEVVRLFLEEKAFDVDLTNTLFDALMSGHRNVVKLLIDYGADANGTGTNVRRPIFWAAHWGHEEVVRLLLEHNVDVPVGESNAWTPLSVAKKFGHEGVVRLLEEYLDTAKPPA